MTELKNLQDLFHHQLKDIYNAETQLIGALPKMQEKAKSGDLKNAFSEHLEQTKNHKKRLEEIGESLGIELSGVTCEAMKGLIREANSLVSEGADEKTKDAGIIADAQKVEHYEISAYGTLRQYAQALDKNDIAEKLNQTLQEESGADQKLNTIAIDHINLEAKTA